MDEEGNSKMKYEELIQLSQADLKMLLVEEHAITLASPIALPLTTGNFVDGCVIHGLALSGRLFLLRGWIDLSSEDATLCSADGRGLMHWLAVGAQKLLDAETSLARVQDLMWALEQGAVLDAQDSMGNTPLHLACGDGHPAFLYALIAKGAKLLPNLAGESPLTVAKAMSSLATSRTEVLSAATALLRIAPFLEENPQWTFSPRFSLTSAYAAATMAYLTYRGDTQDVAGEFNSPNGAVLVLCKRWGFDSVHIASQLGLWGMVAKNADLTVVAFRGTKVTLNWISNLSAVVDLHDTGERHVGFSESLNQLWPQLLPHIPQTAKTPIWVTGHSLGGAMSMLAADNLIRLGVDPQRLVLYTFGQPRVGTQRFQARFDAQCPNAHIIIGAGDPVPTVPPASAGYNHGGSVRYLDKRHQLYNAPHYHFHDIGRACRTSSSGKASLFYSWFMGFMQFREQERIAQEEPMTVSGSSLLSQLGTNALAAHSIGGYFRKIGTLLARSRSPWEGEKSALMTQEKACRFPRDCVKPERYEEEKRQALASWVSVYTNGHPPVFDLEGDVALQVDWFLQEQSAVLALGPYYHHLPSEGIPALALGTIGVSSLMQEGLRSALAWALKQPNTFDILLDMYKQLPMGWPLAPQGEKNVYIPVPTVGESPYKTALIALLECTYQEGLLPMATYAAVLMVHWEYVSAHCGIDATKIMLNRLAQLPIRLTQPSPDWQPRFLYHHFWHCAKTGDVPSLRACMQWGADRDAASSTGKTALMYALEAGQVEVMTTLLEAGAQTSGLLHAIDIDNTDLLFQLLAYGAEINALDPRGDTLLHHAVAKSALERVNMLLMLGADPHLLNSEGKTPLHLAASMDSVWRALVTQGGRPSVTDSEGCTAYRARYGVDCPPVPAGPWEGMVYAINDLTLGIKTPLKQAQVQGLVQQALDPSEYKEVSFATTSHGDLTVKARGATIETLLAALAGWLIAPAENQEGLITRTRHPAPWRQRAITQAQMEGDEAPTKIVIQSKEPIRHFAVQGDRVACSTGSAFFKVMDNRTGQSLGQWALEGEIVALTACAGVWCVGLSSGHVLIVDDGGPRQRFKAHEKAVIHQQGGARTLATAGADNTLSLAVLPLCAPPVTWAPHRTAITALFVLPDDSVLTGSGSGHIRRWRTKDLPLVTYSAHKKAVVGLASLPDGRMASISEDKTLRLWDVLEGKNTTRIVLDTIPKKIQAARRGDLLINTKKGTLRFGFEREAIEPVTLPAYPQLLDHREQAWFKEGGVLRYSPLENTVRVDLSCWLPGKVVSFYPQLMKEGTVQLHCPPGSTVEEVNILEAQLEALLNLWAPGATVQALCITSKNPSLIFNLCQALSWRVQGPWALGDPIRCAAIRRELTSDKPVDTPHIQRLVKGLQNLNTVFERPFYLPTLFALLCTRGGEPAVSWVLMQADPAMLEGFSVPQNWQPLFLQHAFWKAAKTDDVVLFERCILAGVDPMARSGTQKTALDYARAAKAQQIEAYWVEHNLSAAKPRGAVLEETTKDGGHWGGRFSGWGEVAKNASQAAPSSPQPRPMVISEQSPRPAGSRRVLMGSSRSPQASPTPSQRRPMFIPSQEGSPAAAPRAASFDLEELRHNLPTHTQPR